MRGIQSQTCFSSLQACFKLLSLICVSGLVEQFLEALATSYLLVSFQLEIRSLGILGIKVQNADGRFKNSWKILGLPLLSCTLQKDLSLAPGLQNASRLLMKGLQVGVFRLKSQGL